MKISQELRYDLNMIKFYTTLTDEQAMLIAIKNLVCKHENMEYDDWGDCDTGPRLSATCVDCADRVGNAGN